MHKSTKWNFGTIILGSVFLSACGGGSDGNGGGDSAGTLTMDSGNFAESRVVISEETPVGQFAELLDDLAYGEWLVVEVTEKLGDLSAWESGTISCDQGGNAVVDIEDTDARIAEAWTFNDCALTTANFGVVLLNGSYRYTDNLTSSGDYSESWVGSQVYNVTGKTEDQQIPFELKGSTEWDEDYSWSSGAEDWEENWDHTSKVPSLEFKRGDNYAAVTNVTTRTVGESGEIRVSMDGKLLGSAIGGYVQLSTPTTVVFPDYDACATEGVVVLESDGKAEVRYGSSAGGTATSVAVWINGQTVESYDDCSGSGLLFL